MKIDLPGACNAWNEEIQADCSRSVRAYQETRETGCVHFIDEEAEAAGALRRSRKGDDTEDAASLSSALFSIALICDQNDVSLAKHTCRIANATEAAKNKAVRVILDIEIVMRAESMDEPQDRVGFISS